MNFKSMSVLFWIQLIHYECSFIEDFPERQLSHIDVIYGRIVVFCTLMTLLMSTIHNWLVTLDKQISPICLVAVWTVLSEVSRFLACCLLVIFTTMFVSHDFNEYWYLKSLAFHNLADMLLCPVRNQTMESWHMWLITSNKLIFLTLVWSSDVCCFAD